MFDLIFFHAVKNFERIFYLFTFIPDDVFEYFRLLIHWQAQT